VRIWDVATGEAVGAPFEDHTDWVYSVAFSPDGKQIVSASHDCNVHIWDTATREALGVQFKDHTGLVNFLFSSDGNQAVSRTNTLFKIHEGWFSTASALLFWLPSQYRTGFWHPNHAIVIGRQSTRPSFARFVHGSEWTECYYHK
jgi:WD40 repeat protein